jgi:hypothetical protein
MMITTTTITSTMMTTHRSEKVLSRSLASMRRNEIRACDKIKATRENENKLIF